MSDSDDAPVPAKSDARYLLTVSVLMLVIIITLAALWMMERRRRIAAERSRSEISLKYRRLKVLAGGMFPGPPGAPVAAVRREDLPAETVEINGRPRKALRLGAAAGERFGFRPGDIIVIADGSATTRGVGEDRPPIQ